MITNDDYESSITVPQGYPFGKGEPLNVWNVYRQMYTIRRVEETLLDLFGQGKLSGTVHTCIGQEACAVGVVNALDKERDILWSNHRGHGHFLAYCDDVEGLLAEVLGKTSGLCRGIGGSQHLHYKNFYTNGVLGGTVPCAVGCALAEKMKGSPAITTVFFGDGAMGEGIIYESLNIAALWQVPVLFVLEHNQYAQSTPTHLGQAGDLTRRAAAFGISSCALPASDVFAVFQTAQKLVEQVRTNQQPAFLTLHTYRLSPHSKGDDLRPAQEIETYRQRDPLALLRRSVEKDAQPLLALEEAVERRIQAALESALAAKGLPAETFIQEAQQW